MQTRPLSLALAALASLSAAPAMAQSKGAMTVGIGVHNVAPKSDNGTLANGTLRVDAGSSARPTVTGEYFVADNLGIELIAAWPFRHDISVSAAGVNLGKVGSTMQLPPTLSLQYHFGSGKVRPFVGAGVNYTAFYNEKTTGLLAGNRLSLGNSWGIAGHAGIDFKLGEKSAIRIDARMIDIDTDVALNGSAIGTAHIDPVVYGLAYVMQL